MTAYSATGDTTSAAEGTRIVVAPNCSLSGRQALGLFGTVAGVSLLIALVFTLQGYWPVLPFAGAELLLLGWALGSSQKRGGYREVITVSDGRVTLEKGYASGDWQMEFQRDWMRVELQSLTWNECRVLLCSHGQRVQVGECLTCEERKALYERLHQVLQRQNYRIGTGRGAATPERE